MQDPSPGVSHVAAFPLVAPGASILPFVLELTSVVRHTLSIGRRDRPIYPTASQNPPILTESCSIIRCLREIQQVA